MRVHDSQMVKLSFRGGVFDREYMLDWQSLATDEFKHEF
jgi:hypothetical protein